MTPQRRIPKSTWLPIVLLIYLAAMSYIGYGHYRNGAYSALYYFGLIAITLAVITALHFFLKRKERLRREREENMKGSK